mmetsp:Transcript_9463/g.15234  ORF Transcript_9463/g.15234 Transcript_9463/m.15234 type:complete len:483 (-) Transcript_9463:64-1512(-)
MVCLLRAIEVVDELLSHFDIEQIDTILDAIEMEEDSYSKGAGTVTQKLAKILSIDIMDNESGIEAQSKQILSIIQDIVTDDATCSQCDDATPMYTIKLFRHYYDIIIRLPTTITITAPNIHTHQKSAQSDNEPELDEKSCSERQPADSNVNYTENSSNKNNNIRWQILMTIVECLIAYFYEVSVLSAAQIWSELIVSIVATKHDNNYIRLQRQMLLLSQLMKCCGDDLIRLYFEWHQDATILLQTRQFYKVYLIHYVPSTQGAQREMSALKEIGRILQMLHEVVSSPHHQHKVHRNQKQKHVHVHDEKQTPQKEETQKHVQRGKLNALKVEPEEEREEEQEEEEDQSQHKKKKKKKKRKHRHRDDYEQQHSSHRNQHYRENKTYDHIEMNDMRQYRQTAEMWQANSFRRANKENEHANDDDAYDEEDDDAKKSEESNNVKATRHARNDDNNMEAERAESSTSSVGRTVDLATPISAYRSTSM